MPGHPADPEGGPGARHREDLVHLNPEPTDCILCGLCTRVCDHIGVSAISSTNRGWGREIAPPFNQPPPDCIGCLACAEICPTDFIPYETSNHRRTIWGREFEMLRDPKTGEAVITKEQAEHFAERSGVPMTYFENSDRPRGVTWRRPSPDLRW